MDDRVSVLHVDDDPQFLDLVAAIIERDTDTISIHPATSAEEAMDLIETHDIDCIVSDYDMPGMTGIEFLSLLRERDIQLPFILLTGKGSEEIASQAISAGVDDYMQKGGGTDQYLVLANRIRNLVDRHRTEIEITDTRKRFQLLVEDATDVIIIVNAAGTITYASPTSADILGRSPSDLVGTNGFDPIHPDDRERVVNRFQSLLDGPDTVATAEFRYRRGDDTWMWVEARGRNMLSEPVIDGIVIYTRDIAARKDKERRLERYRRIVETMPAAAWITDAHGSLQFVNARFTSFIDDDAEILDRDVGEVIREYTDDMTAEDYRRHVRALLDGTCDAVHTTIEVDLGDGPQPFDFRMVPLDHEDVDHEPGVVGIAQPTRPSPLE